MNYPLRSLCRVAEFVADNETNESKTVAKQFVNSYGEAEVRPAEERVRGTDTTTTD